MGQVIDLQDWRRRHPAGAAKATELSLPWRAPQFLWAEPMLDSSLTVWRAAAVMWASIVLAASGEVGGPQTGRRAQAALSSFGGRP
jgi:hypothetical protein